MAGSYSYFVTSLVSQPTWVGKQMASRIGRALAHQRLGHGLLVDGVGDGLAHLQVQQLLGRRVGARVEVQEHDAHGAAGLHGDLRRSLELLGLGVVDVHDEVHAARQRLGDLGLAIRDHADLDLVDLRHALLEPDHGLGFFSSLMLLPMMCSTKR